MVSTMLMCIGILLVVCGGTAVALQRSVAAVAARALRRRPEPIAHTLGNGSLRIDGMVAAGEQGTLVAPCSGEAVVWFRLRARRRVLDGSGREAWLTVADQQCGTVFEVEDGSGATAQVDASRARVMTTAVSLRELALGAHDRVRLFLEGRGIELSVADRYEEERLRPGDRVLVAGFARREPSAPMPYLYRDTPSTKLVVDAAAGHELVVATPDAARNAVGGAYRAGWVAVLVGVAMVLGGLVGRCVSGVA
jgi:hypothetical protein